MCDGASSTVKKRKKPPKILLTMIGVRIRRIRNVNRENGPYMCLCFSEESYKQMGSRQSSWNGRV